jgi:dephospho-CoA kinase
LVVVDIPLLFEIGEWRNVDVIVVVAASFAIQRERVLARPNMTEEKFRGILSRQLPDAEKRQRAHFLIESDQGFEPARRQAMRIVAALRSCHC